MDFKNDLLNKDTEIIELKIIKCSVDEGFCWYDSKIGQKFKFWHHIFTDDDDIIGLWVVAYKQEGAIFTKDYVYIEDTDYFNYIRKQKLNKIENHA